MFVSSKIPVYLPGLQHEPMTNSEGMKLEKSHYEQDLMMGWILKESHAR
jgi:hypothetical protein